MLAPMSLEHIIEPEIPESFELTEKGFVYQGEEIKLERRARYLLESFLTDGVIERTRYNENFKITNKSRSLDVGIVRLKEKLEEVNVPLSIQAISGFGYALESVKEQDFIVTPYGFYYQGKLHSLSHYEGEFLRKLNLKFKQLLTKGELYPHPKLPEGSRTVDVQISRLRKKLEQTNVPVEIKTKRGSGYRLIPTP